MCVYIYIHIYIYMYVHTYIHVASITTTESYSHPFMHHYICACLVCLVMRISVNEADETVEGTDPASSFFLCTDPTSRFFLCTDPTHARRTFSVAQSYQRETGSNCGRSASSTQLIILETKSALR